LFLFFPNTGPLCLSTQLRQPPIFHKDYLRTDYLTTTHQLEHFICTVEEGGEHLTFQEATRDPRWRAAMDSEIRSITKNNAWTLVECPPHVRPITARWIF
jgi:hypothetical protein